MFRGPIVDEQFDGTLNRVAEMLSGHNLEFALIGGLASSIRGRIRTTADVDIVVDCDVAKAVEILNCLELGSYRPFVKDPELSIRQYFILPIEDVKSGIRIDLAIGASGFEKIIVGRANKPAGYSVPVATAEDLLLMKLMAGRPQDVSDISGIVKVNKEAIDWDYCEEMAESLDEVTQLGLRDSLQRLRSESA